MKITKLVTSALCALSLSTYAQDAKSQENTLANVLSLNQSGKLSGDVKVAYESKYVFRGIVVSDAAIQPALATQYQAAESTSFYASVWDSSPFKSDRANEIDISGGIQQSISSVTFDLGYVCYVYPNSTDADHTNEMLMGVSYDTSNLIGGLNLRPACYYFYDFDLDQQCLEGRLSYSFSVGEWFGVGDILSFDVAGTIGYVDQFDGVYYMYVSVMGDLTCKLTEKSTLALGPRFSHNYCERGLGKEPYAFWFGVSLKMSF